MTLEEKVGQLMLWDARDEDLSFINTRQPGSVLHILGAKISRATWNGRASAEEFAEEVGKMIAEGKNIKYTVFANGTVVPKFLPDDGRNNHIYTWPVAYTIEGLRDWLFSQVKR